MPIDELKKLCGVYYETTEKKENGQDRYLYRTLPQGSPKKKGLVPLGYFDSEYEAVLALYNFLITNKLI